MDKAEPGRSGFDRSALCPIVNADQGDPMTFSPIGIDIAKAKFDAAALRNGKYKTKVFQNTPEGFRAFLAWLQAFPTPHVCLEATGRYGEGLALFLVDHGLAVSGSTPPKSTPSAKPN
ncbi:hypothetical protein EVC37_26390 [Methylocaldum sp. BRCS4]|nr:hypothetical protein [Methylocaldum sp. BRCS4]